MVTKSQPIFAICTRVRFWPKGSKKICCIVKIPKKMKMSRIMSDTIFKGFLGSRNLMKNFFFLIKGHFDP